MQIQLSPDEAAQTAGVLPDVVQPGDVVEVPDELAGRPPTGVYGEKGYDPGEGLLAQSGKWLPVKKAAAKTTKGDS